MCCAADAHRVVTNYIEIVEVRNTEDRCAHDSTVGRVIGSLPDFLGNSVRVNHKLSVLYDLLHINIFIDGQN